MDYVRLNTCSTRFVWRMNTQHHWLLMDVLSCSSNKGLIEHSPEKDFVRLIHCSTRLNSFTNKLELELYIN